MKTKRKNFFDKEAADLDFLSDQIMVGEASVLDDFLDEEVVDKQGTAIGTLECYWESPAGQLVFLGVKLKAKESVRVVPGSKSQISERHSCIRVAFEGEEVAGAPTWECDQELDARLEQAVNDHFGIDDAKPHGELRHVAGRTGKD
jgi:hypothetical protein